MRILILSNKIPFPADDGSSIAMAQLLKNCVDTGHEVSYAALNTAKHYKKRHDFPAELAEQIDLHTFNVNTTPTVFGALKNLLFSNKPYHTIRFYQNKLVEHLSGYGPNHFDLTIIEGAFMADYLDDLTYISARVVLRAHNVEHFIWSRTREQIKNPLKKAYLSIQEERLKRFEQTKAMAVDQVWCLSKLDERWFRTMGGTAKWLPVSVDHTEELTQLATMSCFHLGAMDWLPNRMGVNWLLSEVWPLVLEQIPEAKLHLAGNKFPADIRSNKEKHVVVHGRVKDAKQFAQTHGIALIPLLSGSGMRIKALDNASWGVPMISTPIGTEGVFNNPEEAHFVGESPNEFAQWIIHGLKSSADCLEKASFARREIEQHYSSESVCERLQMLCSSIAL